MLYLESLYDTANLEYDSAQTLEDKESFRKQLIASFQGVSEVQVTPLSTKSVLPPRAAFSPQAAFSPAPAPAANQTQLHRSEHLPLDIFAPACTMHESTDSGNFWNFHAAGQELAPLLTAWFENGARVAVIDQREGPQPLLKCFNST